MVRNVWFCESENVLITFSGVQEMCQREVGTYKGREEEGREEGDGDWQIRKDNEQKSRENPNV